MGGDGGGVEGASRPSATGVGGRGPVGGTEADVDATYAPDGAAAALLNAKATSAWFGLRSKRRAAERPGLGSTSRRRRRSDGGVSGRWRALLVDLGQWLWAGSELAALGLSGAAGWLLPPRVAKADALRKRLPVDFNGAS
jgi:hypothetical protein